VKVEFYKDTLQKVRKTVEEGITDIMKKQCRIVGDINKM
jgi:hypothetical protein